MATGIIRNIRDISPASIICRQRRKKKYKKLRRWKTAALNWLNGLPVKQEDEYDSGSVKDQKIRMREGKSTVSSGLRLKSWFRPDGSKTKSLSSQNVGGEPFNFFIPVADTNLGKLEDFHKREPVRIIQLPPEPLGILPLGHRNDDIYSTTVSNEILTAKYTVLNFLPKNILEQLRRVANVYFVVIIILQCIPAISNYNPILAASPVVAIMAVTAIKDAIEDWRRHQQDNEVNYSICWSLHRPESGPIIIRDTRYQRFVNVMWSLRDWFILTALKAYCQIKKREFVLEGRYRKLANVQADAIAWQETFWRDIRVGDIILLRNNEMISADIILLSSSEPDGVCFVETKNLDGETNLKLKRSPYETSWIQSAADAFYLKATIEVELPHVNLYSFNGKIIIAKDFDESAEMEENYGGVGRSDRLVTSPSPKTIHNNKDAANSKETLGFVEPTIVPISNDGLLLRGCVLRNTPFAIGIVAYTGPHTKLMLNSGGTPSKRTKIERQMNPQIILIFALLFIICLSCAVVQAQFSSSLSNAPYWISSFQYDFCF